MGFMEGARGSALALALPRVTESSEIREMLPRGPGCWGSVPAIPVGLWPGPGHHCRQSRSLFHESHLPPLLVLCRDLLCKALPALESLRFNFTQCFYFIQKQGQDEFAVG